MTNTVTITVTNVKRGPEGPLFLLDTMQFHMPLFGGIMAGSVSAL